jgi:DNA-binding MarR family transcriptional regulator
MSEKGKECYQIFLDSSRKRIGQLMGHFSPEEQVQYLKITTKLLDLLMSDDGLYG